MTRLRPVPASSPRSTAMAAHKQNADEVLSVFDDVADEAPLEIQLAGGADGFRPVAVVMRTRDDDDVVDEDLALGFCLTEGIVTGMGDVASVAACDVVPSVDAEGNIMRLRLKDGVEVPWSRLSRHVFASSSCGVCSKATIDAALATVTAPMMRSPVSLSTTQAARLVEALHARQPLFARTGGCHGAGIAFAGEVVDDEVPTLLVVREDVGRHNAVDKAIGALVRRGLVRTDIAHPEGTLVVSGRVAFELVQKALSARLGRIVGVGAPTSLAVQLAAASGLQLYGFARAGRLNRYC